MMGLVRKNLKAGNITPVWTLVFIAACAVAGFFVRDAVMFLIVFCGLCGGFVANFEFHFLGSNEANWRKLEAVMPVNAAHVERSRYLAHIIVFAITLTGGAAYSLTSYFSGTLTGLDYTTFAATVMNVIATWSVLFISFGAFFFIMSRVQSNAVVVAQIASFFIVIVTVIAFNVAVAAMSGSEAYGFYHGISIWNWIFLGVLLMLYAGSYFLSLHIYRYRLRKKGAT